MADNPGDETCWFGEKHQGKKFSDIASADVVYCLWCWKSLKPSTDNRKHFLEYVGKKFNLQPITATPYDPKEFADLPLAFLAKFEFAGPGKKYAKTFEEGSHNPTLIQLVEKKKSNLLHEFRLFYEYLSRCKLIH